MWRASPSSRTSLLWSYSTWTPNMPSTRLVLDEVFLRHPESERECTDESPSPFSHIKSISLAPSQTMTAGQCFSSVGLRLWVCTALYSSRVCTLSGHRRVTEWRSYIPRNIKHVMMGCNQFHRLIWSPTGNYRGGERERLQISRECSAG